MRRLFFRAIAVSLLAAAGMAAQTPTNVVGTITDPNGLPYNTGTIRADLIPAGGPQPCAGSNPCQTFQSGQQATLSSTGSFQMNLYPNSIITPAGTQWQFTVTEPGVPPPFGFGPVTFIYVVTVPVQATFDISSALSALAPALARAQSGPGTFPRYDQILNPNQSYSNTFGVGITATYTGGGTFNFAGVNITLPAGCTAATTVANICYDSAGNLHVFNDGADSLIPAFSPTFPPGDVLLGSLTGSVWNFGDGGPLTNPAGTTVASYTPVSVAANDVLAFDSTGALFNFTLGLTPLQVSTSSYTFTGAERRELVFWTATGAKTAALPQASELTAFDANWNAYLWNPSSSGNVVITVSGSLFSLYNSSTSPTLTLTPGESCTLTSDSSANSGNGFYYPVCAEDPAVISGGGFITGTFTAGFMPVATGVSVLGNSTVKDDGTNPTRAPNGLDTAVDGNYEEYTVDTGGVTAGQALCVTANVDAAGRPKVLPCSHTDPQPGAGFVGIARTTVAATGTVETCWTVNCSATFDNSTTALDEAILSTSTDGQLHDTGVQTATAGQPNFAVLKSGSGTLPISLTGMLAQNPKGGGGNGNSNAITVDGAAIKKTANFSDSGQCSTYSTSSSGSATTLVYHPCHGLSFTIGTPGGTALTAGSNTTDYLVVPFACTIGNPTTPIAVRWSIAVDSGTATIHLWKIASGTALPTSANNISTSGWAISTGTVIESSVFSDLTTKAVALGDIIGMNLSAASGPAYVQVTVPCQE